MDELPHELGAEDLVLLVTQIPVKERVVFLIDSVLCILKHRIILDIYKIILNLNSVLSSTTNSVI